MKKIRDWWRFIEKMLDGGCWMVDSGWLRMEIGGERWRLIVINGD